MRYLLALCFLFTITSCAKKSSEKVEEAIDVALTYLSESKCDSAIDVLEEAGRDTTNAVYLQVLASAYACRAGYNEVRFLSQDVLKINGAMLFASLTTLSIAPEIEADSESYADLREALKVLLYVDVNQPSQAAKTSKFGPRKAGDLGVQALFLTLNQLGKFIHLFGNVGLVGTVVTKGAGAASVDEQTAQASKCFVEYTSTAALLLISNNEGGACKNTSFFGHPDLSLAPASLSNTKRRMCEGLMLVTNIMDLLNNITLPANPSMGSIGSITALVNTLKSQITAINPAYGTLINTTSQATCEGLATTASGFDNLQDVFAVVFEKGLP